VTYVPADDRYEHMRYRRSGRSGLQLPAVSLGLWQNFGYDRPLDVSRAIVRRALIRRYFRLPLFGFGVPFFGLVKRF
jgi:hypothetical protein